MSRTDIAAIAHVVTVLLTVLGVLSQTDTASVEGALAAVITAAVGLVSQAVIVWKYIHHQKE